MSLSKEEIEKLKVLVSSKTFKYKYKNYTFTGQELTIEQLADWKRRIDETCR